MLLTLSLRVLVGISLRVMALVLLVGRRELGEWRMKICRQLGSRRDRTVGSRQAVCMCGICVCETQLAPTCVSVCVLVSDTGQRNCCICVCASANRVVSPGLLVC